MSAPLRAVLLDVDGTLVDSNDAHARAWVDAFAEAGFAVPFERVRPLIGMGGDQIVPLLTGRSDERISDRRSAIFRERYLSTVKPFPGSRALVERIRARGLRVVVATSANEEDARPLLDVAGIPDLVDAKTTSDDAERSKPHADVICAALERAGVGADEAVLIGDTRYDVEAASRAGVRTIAVRCGGSSDEELRGSIAIYDGPAELADALDEVLTSSTRR